MEAKLLVSSGLFRESHFRRLFKARHHEISAMEIRTHALPIALVSDPTTPRFTVYALQIQSSLRREPCAWTLEKRYSEFVTFRVQYLRHIREWESAVGFSTIKNSLALVLISNALRKPITPTFPRKHMRCDTDEIIRARRMGLQAFVRKLLDTYADLSVYMATGHDTLQHGHEQLRAMFTKLEQFLEIPQALKEIERIQVAAILSLQDVEDEEEDENDAQRPEDDDDENEKDTETSGGRVVCCICLTKRSRCHSEQQRHDGSAQMMVKLPCNHQFHEDCVIDWFNASPTCPLCRRTSIAVVAAPLAMPELVSREVSVS
uniref:RING-type domain-containing protein n=1 Tax=Globisporangium ultimum (strain ATCC 200006 / CBS 805.95 / DAOM BR144) TaxID=431595 RepID=K3WCZ8_GLOUD